MIRQLAKQVRGPLDAAFGPAMGSMMRVDTPRDELVLTFDDGPYPGVTEKLAEVLADHDAHAVFFVLMTRTRRAPGLVRELSDAGHEIALHGMDHRRITTLGLREADRWLMEARDELEQDLGHQVRWFRPPHGAQSPQHRLLAARAGMHPVLWSGTTWDWKDVSHEERIAKAMGSARPGAIVLAHDGSADARDLAVDQAVEGVDKPALLDEVLSGYADRGLSVVTLSQALLGPAKPVNRLSFSA